MDIIREIIGCMLPAERAHFQRLLGGKGGKDGRKDLRLFRALLRTDAPAGRRAAGALYGQANLNAYHSVRKRLSQHLLSFIAEEYREESSPLRQKLHTWKTAARYLLNRDAAGGAAVLLTRATRLAGEQQWWQDIDELLSFQVEHAHQLGLEVQPLIEQWEENKRRKTLEDKMRMALGMIRNQLARARADGRIPDLDAMTRSTFRQIDMGKEVQRNVVFMHLILTIARSAVMPTRDYRRFEQFAVRTWRQLVRVEDADPERVLDILYMIAHVKYRSRKFIESAEFLEEMQKRLSGVSAARYPVHRARMLLLQCALHSYSGDNEQAIRKLRAALTNNPFKLPLAQRINMQINLCVYLFQSRNFREANKVLLGIGHSDQWLEKKMGKEWRFKRDLIHIIIQLELGHDDIALRSVQNLERTFAAFLQQPFYQRAGVFTGFIRKLMLDPGAVRTPAFEKELESANLALPGDREDTQAITFFCWLKSKMLGRDYYTLLLEMMQPADG